MDVAAFSDDNFDVKEWINKMFKTAEAQENKDAFVSSLVMKLQLYVQQVNSALEDTSQQVLQSLPRVMRDTEILHQEALVLRDKMQLVKQEIAKVEQDTGQSMATLERIDHIKTELQAAKQALHEADNWTILAADLEEVFESGNIESISAKLVSMQQSLLILVNVPDYEDRKLQLEGLKNRLEAMASPLLVQAFTSSSVDQSRVFVRIFAAIDRLPQLLKYYHKCQKGALLQQWHSLVGQEQDEGVAEWLHKMYDTLLSNWQEQVKWCGLVFTSVSPVATLLELYADVLSSLDPGLNSCIDAALKRQADPLLFLIDLKQVTKHFAGNLQAAVESSSPSKQSNRDAVAALAIAVYAPYVSYVSRYSGLEQAAMLQQLPAMHCSSEDQLDTVQGLGQSIPRATAVVDAACKRCLGFTEGCGYQGLLQATKAFLNGYLDKYRAVLRQLNQQVDDREDWAMFQMCLTFLQNVGELFGQLKQLDRDLCRHLLEVSRRIQAQEGPKEGNAFTRFKLLLLSPADQKELDSLISKVQQGGGEDLTLLDWAVQPLTKLSADAQHTTFQVIFSPISSQLDLVQAAPAWSSDGKLPPDLPDFSYSPQEYITQIGQYLMTLPQHLEPFLLQDSPSLPLAEWGSEGGFADMLLALIARSTCQTYCDHILGICELSPGAAKQLATDIDYLGNVLEDLGLALSEHLQQLAALLRLPPDEYQAKSSGSSPRLVAAVRQMRNLTSSS